MSAKVADLDFKSWNRILVANLTGTFLCTHHSLPILAEDAHLFYLGAVSKRLRLPGLPVYAAAKAGLEAFGEVLRKEGL
jgi:NAD(P)-dependent dehydrogenase (short-subunit alcohol dehydrogenase family)